MQDGVRAIPGTYYDPATDTYLPMPPSGILPPAAVPVTTPVGPGPGPYVGPEPGGGGIGEFLQTPGPMGIPYWAIGAGVVVIAIIVISMSGGTGGGKKGAAWL